MNTTGTKDVRIMKQTAFWREKKESIYNVSVDKKNQLDVNFLYSLFLF